MSSFYRLKDFFIRNKFKYIIGLFCLLFVDLIQLLVPKIIGNLTDDFTNNVLNNSLIIKYSFYIILTGLLIGIGRFFWRTHIITTSRVLEYELRKKLFNHILSLSPNYFNNHKTGDLMSHATNDINAVRIALSFGIIIMVDSIFIMILSIFMMIRTTSLKLTILAIFNLPIIIYLTRNFGKKIYKRSRIVQESFSNLTNITQESFSGIRVIKSFVQDDLISKKFSNISKENLNKNLNLVKTSGILSPLLQFIASTSVLITIFYGGRQVILGYISLGDFVAFNSYLGLLTFPTRGIGRVINVLQRGAASMDRLNLIFDEKSEILPVSNPIYHKILNGKIEFKNVNFKYENSNHNALSNISFTLNPGKTLAIVGKTGSGKTTLVNTLLRLYDIHHGEILLDEQNIKNYNLKTLRENIAYVPQDNFLFSKTIKYNIGFGFENLISDEKIYQAAKFAQVYNNIIDFPDKFDTILGERGITLSGGQKQRVSLARAIIKNPSILILDDSFSAIDTQTEEKILDNLKGYAKDKTTIIISHRISTIKSADEILHLDSGEIIERGTHEELLSLNGSYKDLYEKQLLEDKINQEEE